MTILIDTNILLRLLQHAPPHCALVERAVGTLRTRNETLNRIAPEPDGILGRGDSAPSENGLGMTVENAAGELTSFQRLFTLLPETASVYQEWERLVSRYQVSGKNSHDAHIVAAMNVHAITRILTLNVRDFTRYSDISAVTPRVLPERYFMFKEGSCGGSLMLGQGNSSRSYRDPAMCCRMSARVANSAAAISAAWRRLCSAGLRFAEGTEEQ